MKRIIAYVVLLLVLVGCGGGDSPATQARPATQRQTVIRTLLSGEGRSSTVSEDFTVPAGCSRQNLTYSGERISGSGGFINFRVYDLEGNPADSAVGPVDLDEVNAGTAMWKLDAGEYAVEVTSDNARWEYSLKCR